MTNLTTKELAMKCHEAEYTDDDMILIQVMNEVERRERYTENYYAGWFMEQYRATMKEAHEKFGKVK